jgi:hypothetical protein
LAHGTATNLAGAAPVGTTNPLPVEVRNDSRVFVQLYATAAATGATTVETLVTLSKSASPGATVTTGTSFAPTAGKRFRITSITFATRGNNTATAQATTFSVRVNTAGAAGTSSNVILSARCATPSTANAWDRFDVRLGADGIELVAGTLQFCVTVNSVYTSNAPTVDVAILGYEY